MDMRRLMRVRVRRTTVLSMALVCTACTASPSPNATTGSPNRTSSAPGVATSEGARPRLSGTVIVNGAYQARASFNAQPEVTLGDSLAVPKTGDTCADYASGFTQNPTSFAVPELQTTVGTTVYVRIAMAHGYRGSGTYTSCSTPMLIGVVALGVGDLAGAGYIDTFRSGYPGTTTLTVRADGSGTVVFSGWDSGGADISGSISWICEDPVS